MHTTRQVTTTQPRRIVLFAAGALLVGAAGTILMATLAPETLVDEPYHEQQIRWFTEGFFALQPALPMPPTYHAFIAAPAALLGLDSLVAYRTISMLVGLSSLAIFFQLARSRGDRPIEHTLQFFFLPILFPYLFVLYTDVTSILVLLTTGLLVHRRRYLGAGLAGFLAVLTRQTNIFWLGFFFLWDVLRFKGEDTWWQAFTAGLRRNAVLVATAPALGAFVAINGRPTLDEPALHPLGIYGGNVWFFFITAFFALAPLHLANHRKVFELLRRPAVIGGTALALSLYWFTFTAPHPLNESLGFQRNLVLNAAEVSVVVRVGLFVLIAYTALSLLSIRLGEPGDYLIYPFTLLALLPSMLIEVRYMIFPLVWIVLARRRSDQRHEGIFLAYEITISLLALWAIAANSLFY